MCLSPDFTDIQRSADAPVIFRLKGLKAGRCLFRGVLSAAFAPLAGGCGVWLKRLNHLNIKSTAFFGGAVFFVIDFL